MFTQLTEVDDGQNDIELKELSASDDLPVNKLTETAISKLI